MPDITIRVRLLIITACGSTPADIYVGPILAKPTSNFTVASKTCVGSQLTFTNTTVSGKNYDFNSNACNSLTKYSWNFGDGSPVVETDYITSPLNTTHTFTAAGTYSVTLTTESYCGVSTKVQSICVEPTAITPAFTLDTEEGCGPLTVTATNGTNTSNTCPTPPTYLWEVTYASG